jgi:anti-sigma factor RsiW
VSPEEAEERFSAAFDGELSEQEQAAFEATLKEHPELAEEYEEFAQTMREVAAFAMEDLGEEEEGEVPDLLSGVQDRLRERSRGRFYRDRFSRNARRGPPFILLVGLVMLVTLAVTWMALRSMVIVEEAPEEIEPGSQEQPSSEPEGASERE